MEFQRKLAERRREEQEHAQKIAELEEQALYAEDNFATVQEEVQSKTKRLRKLITKYANTRTHMHMHTHAHAHT